MIIYINDLNHFIIHPSSIYRIYYFGNFTRRGSYAIEWLDYATKFWNKDLLVRFNSYDGYLGSIGSLVDESNDIQDGCLNTQENKNNTNGDVIDK